MYSQTQSLLKNHVNYSADVSLYVLARGTGSGTGDIAFSNPSKPVIKI